MSATKAKERMDYSSVLFLTFEYLLVSLVLEAKILLDFWLHPGLREFLHLFRLRQHVPVFRAGILKWIADLVSVVERQYQLSDHSTNQ